MLDISCESSARQKIKVKKIKPLLQFLCGALRANG